MEIDSTNPDKTHVIRHKRHLFKLKKDHNDIYITGSTPLCVYFKRARQLLQWQLSRYDSLASKEFLKEHRINRKSGNMANRSRIMAESYRADSSTAEVAQVCAVMSKRHISVMDHKLNGINIYGTGKCVNKALYVLQDIYEFVKDLFTKGHRRFNHSPVHLDCAACVEKTQQVTKEGLKDDLSPEQCPECLQATNEYLEQIVNKIITVDITTGTVTCHDDVYRYKAEEPLSDRNPLETFLPLESCNVALTRDKESRSISSIKISIRVTIPE